MDDFDLEVGRSVNVGNSLEYTIRLVAASLGRELDDYDKLRIEEKYVDLLVNLWLSEAPEQVVKYIHYDDILKFTEKLNLVNTFVDSYNLLCEVCLNPQSNSTLLKYSFLVKELTETSSKAKDEERHYVSNFKRFCRVLLENKYELIKNEHNFIEQLQNLLKSSKSPDKLCTSLGLLPNNINDFENVNNFKKVLRNITEIKLSEEYFLKVQQSAKKIMNQNDFTIVKNLKEIIQFYVEPVVIEKKHEDGRDLLEVLGKHLVVSKLITEIEGVLKECKELEEVRFVSASVIHIDTNLSAAIWHGKNIVVYANTAIISNDKNILWDVSGEDAANPTDRPEAGTGVDGNGLSGADGQNGESGGNVTIMVGVMKNSHNLTVKSNGGNASNGQDGGKGIDGVDGYYLDKKAFKAEFPPVSKWMDSGKKTNLEITKKNVLKNFEFLNEFYVGNSDMLPMSKLDFQKVLIEQINNLNSFYFKVKTKDGCKITFSFYCGGLFTVCQSFLLHEGSLGTEGKLGGLGGRGGIEGYAGEISIEVNDSLYSDLTILGEDGKEGLPGKQGTSGKPGKAGLDRAYEDYSVCYTSAWPKWVIPDVNENIKLKVIYCNEDSSERVFCQHNNLYAEIVKRENEINKINRWRNDMKLTTGRTNEHLKTHNQRKKTISEKSIKDQYAQKMCSIDLFNLSDSIKSTLQNNAVDETESEHKTTEDKIVRLPTYFEKNLMNYHNLITDNILDYNFKNLQNNDSSVTELIGLVKRDPTEIHNWTHMLLVRLDMSQLQDLWETASSHLLNKQLFAEKDNEQFKIGFCNKYQLAVLEYLSKIMEVSNCYDIGENVPVDMSPDGFDKFFTISKEDAPRSDLNRCLLRDTEEDREALVSAFRELFETFNDNELILDEILMIFLSESHSFSPDLLPTIEKVNTLRESNASLISVRLDSLKCALRRENDGSIFNELYEGVVGKNHQSLVLFENKVQGDKLLSSLYNSYVKKAKQKFGWVCLFNYNDNATVEQTYRYLVEYFIVYGPLSVCYREFLAYHFETNILIYSRNLRNQIILTNNHNPRAETSVYFLMEGNKFLHLNVNNDFVDMYKTQKSHGGLLSDILIHIDSFIEKYQFDTFVSKCSTSSNLYTDVKTSKSLKIRTTLVNILMEESNVKKILNAYHLEDSQTKSELSCRLEKLKREYTECETILHILSLHFENEGNHISAKELIYIVNVVLKCALDVPHVIPLVFWILATHSQHQWLVEIMLLKLELHFKKILDKKLKASWREYLKKLNGETILLLIMEKICDENFNATEEQFEETIYLLSNISQAHVGLDQLNITEWKYYLKNKFWAHQLIGVAEWSNDVLNSSAYYLVVLENLVGFDLCEKLIKVLKEHKSELDAESTKSAVPNIFSIMTNKDVCLNDSLLKLLTNNNISDWEKSIENECFSKGKDRTIETLVESIQNSDNTSQEVKDNLRDVAKAVKQCGDAINTIKQHIKNESQLKEWISTLMNDDSQTELSFISKLKNYLTTINITDNTFKVLGKALMEIYTYDTIHSITGKSTKKVEFLEPNQIFETLFATVVSAVEIKRKLTIRDTQKLAIMTMLKSKKNILNQVSTGEGKTFIIVIFAIVKVLMGGQKVDIITSSRVLAERDSKDNKEIYDLFGINVGHNCSEDIEERKQAYSNNNVVYGELANFQRDYLLDHVYNKNIIGDRSFDTIVVDEVDSMLLDKGNNTLYLSHEIPGLDKLESVFMYIWKYLHIPLESNQLKLEQIVSVLKSKVMYDLFGIIWRESLKYLDTAMDDRVVNNTWNCLVRKGIIDNTGKVLRQHIGEDFKTLPEKCINKDHLEYIFKKVSERETSLSVPNYLKQFVEDHLEEWIKNGVRAMSMEERIDYVVDIDRSGSSCDRSPNIMLVDQDTGTDMINSQWENGLHQFLQLKHGCRLSLISLKAVFISNVSYLKRYKHLYGLTGTLGSEVERDLLKETYQVNFVTIPTAKTKFFTEESPIVCSSRVDWSNKVCEEAFKIINHRSVLIICETVSDVMYLKEKMKDHFVSKKRDEVEEKIHTYTREYEKLTIANKLQPGHIIISTNLAGRGTDIILSKELIKSGGLHVCLSYLPRNSRIEEQAFGRAARNGQPGSGRIIFENCTQHTALTVIHLKQQRDINEVMRIAEIKNYHKSHIQPEEDCFEKFLEVYSSIKKKNPPHPEYLRSLLLQISLDQWAFWLEANSGILDIKSVTEFVTKISILKEDNFENWSEIIENPFQLVKVGLALAGGERYDEAITLFNRVIEEEPLFSEGAQYYRLYAKSKKENLSKNDILVDMNIVAKQLTKRIDTSSLAAYTGDCLKKRNLLSVSQIESFKEQQLNVSKINRAILQSIHKIIGHEIVFEEFILPTYMDEETAFIVFNDLVDSKMISERKVKNSISEEDFPFAVNYGMLPKELCSVLEKYKNESFNENEIINILEKCQPSRELFWSELISKQILINEKTYCVVNLIKLEYVDSSLVKMIDQLKNNYMESNNEIWLYQPHELCYSESDCVIVRKEILLEKIGELKYTHLLNRYIINLNKVATLLETGVEIKFDQFDSLRKEDFSKIGISSTIALPIICELEDKCIVKKNETTDDYMLLADSTDLLNLELSKYKAYSSDTLQLLNCCFSFRIALKKLYLYKAKQMDNNEKLHISLPIKPHLNIINDLYEHKIVTGYFVNPEKDIAKELKVLYPESMKKEEYGRIFKDLYDETTTSTIIEYLISSKCLTKTNVIKGLVKEQKLKLYSINMDEVNKLSLPPQLKCQTETIKLVLERRFNLRGEKMKEHIEHRINCHESMLHKVETPSFSLKLLSSELQQHKLPSNEFGIFSLNGFESILVIEEKKYTFKMVVCTSGLALLGIAEIAAGVMFSLSMIYYPLHGALCISEGIGDLIYSISCLYSGYFSLKDYAINKAISLTISALCFLKPVEMFKSVFGKSLSSGSSSLISSAKDSCSSLFGKVKTFFSSAFKTSASTIDTAVTIRTLAKQVATKTAVGCSIGLTFVAVDNFLEPQLEKLGKALVERNLGDIDEIDSYNTIMDYMMEIHLLLGDNDATEIVYKSYHEVLEEYKVKNKNDWAFLVHKLTTIVNMEYLKDLNQLRKKNISLEDSRDLMLTLIGIIKKLYDFVESAGVLLPKSIIPEIMENLEQNLKKKLDQLRTSNRTRIKSITDTEKKGFISKMLDELKSQINSVCIQNISSSVITPLLNTLKTTAGSCLIKMGSKQCSFYKQEDIKEFIDHNEQIYKNKEFSLAEKPEHSNRESWYCMDYDECVLELFKRKRCVPLYLEILNNNSSVDDYFIELCCSVIPLALRQEGVIVPMLRVVVEKNGKQHIYGGNIEAETDALTITVSPDETLLTNLGQNKILIRNVLDTTYRMILKHYPEYKGLTSDLLHHMVISAVESNFFIHEYIGRDPASVTNIYNVSDDISNMYSFKSEEEIQNETTEDENCHKLNEDAKPSLVSTANTKVLEVKPLSQMQVVKTQIIEVFKNALAKVNYHLQLTQPHFRSFKLTLEDFIEMRHVIISNNVAGKYFDSYATRYELVVPLVEPSTDLLLDYNVTMSLNVQCSNKFLQNSLGPRIEFSIVPVNIEQSVHLENCIKGHILLGFDYQHVENIHNIDHCHSAGELVLPTLHKNSVSKKVKEKKEVKEKEKGKEKKEMKGKEKVKRSFKVNIKKQPQYISNK